MTRPRDEVGLVLALARDGASLPQIVDFTGLPRTTVRDWLSGKLPGLTQATVGRCWRCRPELPCEEAAYVRLLGVYLGDGSIARFPRGVYRLALYQDARYVRLIREWANLSVVVLARTATVQPRLGCVAVNSYSKHWPCMLPQHAPGPKHLRPIILEPWQRVLVDRYPQQLLRGLIESDGSRHVNRVVVRGRTYEYSRYNFTNASNDIRGIFTGVCDALGVHWTRTGPRVVAISRRPDCDYLDTFIGPKS